MNNKSLLKRTTTLLLALAMVSSNLPFMSLADEVDTSVDVDVTEDESVVEEVKTVSLTMGTTKSEVIFTWLSTSANDSFVKVTDLDGTVTEVQAAQTDYTAAIGYYSYNATLNMFDEEGDYAYQVGNDVDGWSDLDYVEINDATDDGSYSFLAVGDPQIGSSNATTDGEGWSTSLDLADAWFGDDLDFVVSVGDQVNASSGSYKEEEYDAYFSADILSALPSSVTAGNHENYTYSTYSAHFTSPSTSDDATTSTYAGEESGDYWFEYEGTLFISLNSNEQSTALHYAFIESAIEEFTELYGTPTWQIVSFHHSIFSSASHYADSDILSRQSTWADMFSDFNIDLVLMGHDHVYTRSVLMQGMNPTDYADNSTEDISDYLYDPNDGEVLYVTLNSASGSKYYSIQNYDLDYVAVKDQTNTPNITKIDVTDNSITITTYYSDEGNTVEDIVDQVTIVRSDDTTNSYEKSEVVEGETYDDIHEPNLTVPSDSTIYVGDDYDVMSGVSASDIDYYYDYYYDYTEDESPTIDLTDDIVVVGSVDTTTPGIYKVNYYVADASGKTAAASVTVTVREKETLIDGDLDWTATDDGYEATFNFTGDIADFESVTGSYSATASAVVYINDVQVSTYTASSRPGSSSTGSISITGDDLSCILIGENTITVETTGTVTFSSLIAIKPLNTSDVLDYTFYPAVAIDSVYGVFNDDVDTILNAELISSFSIGGSDDDGGLVEIVCYNTDAMVAYAVSGSTGELIVIDMSSLTTDGLCGYGYDMQTLVGEVDGFVYGDMSSVAVNSSNTLLAVALQSADYAENGLVAIFELNSNGIVTGTPTFIECGAQPDALTFTPDGTKILVANEGEPREGYSGNVVDPEGSVTIIDVATLTGTTVTFDDNNLYIDEDVLIKTGATASEDLEPEFIATTNTVAYVALQENNAIAILDLTTGEFTGVYSLGFIDYSEIAIDIVADGEVNVTETYENLYGIRMPDGISIYEVDGTTYLYTANEGDGREWGEDENEYVNEYKSKTSLTGNIVLDEKITWFDPTDYDMLEQDSDYLFGGRSFSIFEVTDNGLELVYDSANEFSDIVALTFEEWYNCSNDDIEVEDRAGKKGVEPEYTVVGEVDGEVYAMTGLERQGGIMIYNVTDPENAYFVNYINSRDYSDDIAGDVAPEGLAFISAQDSPTGNALLLVANEVSGTMSVIELTTNDLYVAPSVDEDTDTDTDVEDDTDANTDTDVEADTDTDTDADVKEDTDTDVEEDTDVDAPATGDARNNMAVVLIGLILVSGLAMVIIIRKKRV